MGEPTRREPRTAAVAAGPTRGTETSQYPQEKKTTVIPRVAASESGAAQTAGVEARRGVVGAPAKQTAEATGTAWKGGPQGVRAPYGKRDTRNPVRSSRDHPARLNTTRRPIVDKYREGKVKSTPCRGVKENLKPDAYKRSEPSERAVTACLLHNEPTSCRRRRG